MRGGSGVALWGRSVPWHRLKKRGRKLRLRGAFARSFGLNRFPVNDLSRSDPVPTPVPDPLLEQAENPAIGLRQSNRFAPDLRYLGSVAT